MATKIRHKRSGVAGTAPTAGQLDAGEFALNTADGKVYVKKDDNSILDITSTIFKNNTEVTVTDTGTDGTITAVADGTTVATLTSTQVSLTQNTAIENAKTLQMKEATGSGTNFAGIKAPNSLAGNYTLTLPTATGGLNQILRTDGSGQLNWTDADTFGSNRVYVSATKGNDGNDGITAPVLTIKRALQIASGLVYTSGSAVNGTRVNVIVGAGDYYIDNPIIVPDNVTVKGDSLRSVNIRPLNPGLDLLRVRNGCYFGEFTFRDGLASGVPSYTFAYAVAFDDPLDINCSRVGYTYLPTTKPLISQSPYIQNCSLISFLGGNGVLVDGSKVVTPNTPTNQIEAENPVSGPAPEQGKSMVANAFTMLSFGGTGWRVINDAYVQIVSCFQIFMLNGCYTQSGGYCSITNSATNFGVYALRSNGYSPNVFAFDQGYIGTTGTVGSIQTITAFGFSRPDGPVEEFVVRIYDPSTNADLTSTYKSNLLSFLEVNFDAATDVNAGTNIFTIVGHGFNNGDAVTYDSNGGTELGGIFNGDVFYIKFLTLNTFSLAYDDSLTRDVDILAVGLGTQKLRKQDYEMFVGEVIETHNTFQTLTLALGSPSGYTFVAGDVLTGLTSGFPNNAYVYSYNAGTRELVVSINKVTIGLTETRNQFAAASTIVTRNGIGVSYTVSSVASRTDLYGARFQILPTITGGTFTSTATLPGKKIWFHRPSITNSSAHTWEYAGSGTDYNALPQNGGQTVPEYEQVSQNAGRVYTSGTNELGDFKVGTFITAFNRTGNVTFTNKITVDTLDVLRLGVGGVTVETISTDVDLGENETGGPKDSRISTQLAVYSFAQNRLGNVLDKNVSTNAVPGSLVQLNSNGQINADLIPTSRSFTNFSSSGLDSRLSQVNDIPASDILAGDIATENFQQQELTISSAVTASVGATVIQTVGNTATTAITSGANSFTVTHSGAITVTKDTYVLLEGVTPSAYNGVWLVNRSSAGSFEVFSNINPGTATVQGTIYYGGASGILKSSYTSATSIIVGSVFGTFNTAFTTGADTLIIAGDRTPSDTNTTVTVSVATVASSSSSNYFLRASTNGQYLILDPTSSPTYTAGSISSAFRYNNEVYLTTTAAHNFSTGNAVKIDAGTDSYDDTEYVTVTSSTEFYYSNIAADSATAADTTATATLDGAAAVTTMTGSVPAAGLSGTIATGQFVFDTGGTIPKGSKITTVNMAVDPRTFTITFPAASTVAATTTATLKFFAPSAETGTVRSVITAADSLSQGEFTEYRPGVITAVNNLTGLTGGSGYTNGTYTRVPLTNVTGSGVGALADITVAAGAVTNVDVVFGGANYSSTGGSNTLSASNTYLGGGGSGFQITVSAVEKRIYMNLLGGQTFVATNGAPDLIEHNSSTVLTGTATTTVVATFDATSTGSGGGVDTLLNRITTLAAHGFTNGDPVQYNPGVDPAVGGLITNNVYYVKVINSTTVELYTAYNLATIIALATSTGAGHTLTRRVVDTTKNTLTFPAHGFLTGDAFRIKGSNLPSVDAVQITENTYWFVGSVTTNSFTIHPLRADALNSTAGITLSEANITAVGTGTITLTNATIKAIGTVNTSSTVRDNWNSLVTTNIDASNIISGIIATSRLATGTANSSTFLRGDSTWATAVKSAQIAVDSVLSITGSGSSPFYGDLTFDVAKADKTGGAGGYSTTGVASFNTTQFSVGTGDSLSAGQVLIKAGVIDAGTLDTYDSSYFLNPSNLTSNVPVNRGGTNIASYGIGDMLYASAATTLNTLNIDVADTVMTSTGTEPQWSSKLTIADVINTTGATVGTSSTSAANVFNSNANALNVGGDAEAIYIGSSAASQDLTANVKSYTTGGSLNVLVTANIGLNATISTVDRNGSNIATIVTTDNHGLTNGDTVTIVCTSDSGFNAINASVTVSNATTFTYSNTGVLIGTTAGSGTVFIGATGIALATNSANNEGFLRFASTTGVRAGMLVQGNAFIPAGTYVTGVGATRVYLSANVTGIITATNPIAFTDTPRSLGINTGDQITIASSGVTALNGTWPVTTAGLSSQSFVFKISTATTQTNLARAGTIIKESTLLLRNRNVTIGSSEASTSPVSAVIKGENGVGTNIGGAALTIRPGLSTGTGTTGVINFQTGTTDSTGDVTNTAVTRMTLAQSSAATTLDLITAMTTANVFNTIATTGNLFGAGTTVNIGANSGTLTIGNPTVVGTQTTQNLYNTVATTVNFAGAATTLEIGAATGTTSINNNLTVDGNTTLGDASGDTVTINASTVNVPNTITFTQDDGSNNAVSFPIIVTHTTSGTPANGIGTGIQLITETTNGNNEIGTTIESVVTDVTATSEDFDFIIRQMIAGAAAAQTLKLNLNSLQVGANNTATTITTQGTANLTLSTNNGTNSGTILINNGTNGNIEIAPNGTGDVYLTADTVRIGDSNAAATITTNGTGDLTLNTNSGTNSGSITIANGANGNITIQPDGTGDVLVNADTLRIGDNNATAFITNQGTASIVVNPSTDLVVGNNTSSATPTAKIIRATDGAGTNIVAANLQLQGGLSTGNATGGSITFATGTTLASGTGAQAATTRLSVTPSANNTTLDLVTSMTTANIINTNATTGNIFGVATGVNVATGAASASTLTFGPAITANTFKIGSTAGGTINLTTDVTTGVVNIYTSVSTGTVNLATGGAGTINVGGAAAALNLGTTAGDSTLTIRGNATTGTATLATNAATANVFNGNATTVNIAGAGTTVALGANSGTLTIGNPTVVGTQTTVNLWNTVSTTVNAFGVATAVNLATSAAAASTLTFGPAITANTFKIGSTTGGTISLTSDVTTGTINLYTGTTTGTINLATGGASTTNIGGAAAAVNIGTTSGNSTLTLNGNGTGGTATITTNVTTGTVTWMNAVTGTVNLANAATTWNVGNTATAAQTVNMFGGSTGASTYNIATGVTAAATTKTLNIGTGAAASSTTNVNIGSSNGGTTTINSGTLVGALTTQNVFNTVATTGNLFGAATTIAIGAASGTLTIGNATITATNATTLNLNGASPSIATTSTGTASVFNTNALTGNLFGAATTVTLGYTGTAASTTNVSTGAVAAATTKTVNLGTGGAASSTTNVNIGSSNGGTTTINSTTCAISGALTVSVNNAVSAAGSTQGTATAITTDLANVTTVAASTGVILPTASAGRKIIIRNSGANTLRIYPASGAQINSLGTNAFFSLETSTTLEFIGFSATQWYTLNATFA